MGRRRKQPEHLTIGRPRVGRLGGGDIPRRYRRWRSTRRAYGRVRCQSPCSSSRCLQRRSGSGCSPRSRGRLVATYGRHRADAADSPGGGRVRSGICGGDVVGSVAPHGRRDGSVPGRTVDVGGASQLGRRLPPRPCAAADRGIDCRSIRRGAPWAAGHGCAAVVAQRIPGARVVRTASVPPLRRGVRGRPVHLRRSVVGPDPPQEVHCALISSWSSLTRSHAGGCRSSATRVCGRSTARTIGCVS